MLRKFYGFVLLLKLRCLGVLFFIFFPLAGREYAAREFRPRNLSHNNYYFQATALCFLLSL